MKLILERIVVEFPANALWPPVALVWRTIRYDIDTIHRFWRARTQWWVGDVDRLYVLISSREHTFEIFQENRGPWTMFRVHD